MNTGGGASESYAIIEFVEEFWPELKITHEELEQPTCNFVIAFYEKFQASMLELLDRMQMKSLSGNHEPCRPTSADVFSLLNFINSYLKEIFPELECLLTLTDLYEPSARRTKIRFKVLINLLGFYYNKVETVNGIAAKYLARNAEYDSKLNERENLKVRLAQEAESLANLDDGGWRLQKELEKEEHLYNKLQEQRVDSDRNHKKMKHDFQVLVNMYDNKLSLKSNFKTNIESLNKEVVSEDGYRSLLALKDNLNEKRSTLEIQIQDTSVNLEGRMPVLEAYQSMSKIFHELIVLCEELKEGQSSSVAKQSQFQMLMNQYKEKNAELLRLIESKVSLEGRIKMHNEGVEAQKLKYNMEKGRAVAKIKLLEIEMVEEKRNQEDIKRQGELLQKNIEKLKINCEELDAENTDLNAFYAATYKNMLKNEDTVTQYFNAVLQELETKITGYNH